MFTNLYLLEQLIHTRLHSPPFFSVCYHLPELWMNNNNNNRTKQNEKKTISAKLKRMKIKWKIISKYVQRAVRSWWKQTRTKKNSITEAIWMDFLLRWWRNRELWLEPEEKTHRFRTQRFLCLIVFLVLSDDFRLSFNSHTRHSE